MVLNWTYRKIVIYLVFERGIRGGQSVIFNKYAEANNKYMEDYDKDMDNTFISFLDANDLYGHAMNRPFTLQRL